MIFDPDDPLSLPKWQWVLRPPLERPVRHWWANLAHHDSNSYNHYHHHQKHNRRSASQTMTTSTSSSTQDSEFDDYHSKNFHNSGSSPLFECHEQPQCPGIQNPEMMTIKGSLRWIDRVCNASTLDRRVRELLTAIWLCPQHKVCQILSPEELRNLGGDDHLCRYQASKLWQRFRNIFLVIRDFSDVFQEKFDTADYSVIFNSNQCQASSDSWALLGRQCN